MRTEAAEFVASDCCKAPEVSPIVKDQDVAVAKVDAANVLPATGEKEVALVYVFACVMIGSGLVLGFGKRQGQE